MSTPSAAAPVRARVGRGRLVLLAAGVALVLVALLPELRSVGQGGFGRVQVLVLGLGLVLVVIGWFGRRSAALYRDFTVMAVNTVILLLLVEFAAGFALRFMAPEASVSTWKQSSYYASRDWGGDYWREFAQVNEKTRYHPYVVWRRAPFHGRLIDVNDDGIRRTPGAVCDPGALTVYTFGGSAMWGMGAPDWGTIPAYLERDLSQRTGHPVCVVNYAELGFVSTQGVIQLARLLEAGTVPDVVIFYDGVNDVATAHKYRRAGLHFELSRIGSKLEGTAESGERWFTHTNLYRLAHRTVLASRAGAGSAGAAHEVEDIGTAGSAPASDSLAHATAFAYLMNLRMVSALARDYGFEYGFFWQPNMATGAKPLVEEERELFAQTDTSLASLHRAVHARIGAAASPGRRLFDLSSVFDHDSTLVYVDGTSHISPEGNRRVATAILDAMWPGSGAPRARRVQ